MKPNLTPRAILALSTAGVSLFLLLCFSSYGTREAMSAMPPTGWSDTLAAWCIRPLGVGAHVIAILGLVWGVIVYFQERTPDLVLRMAGATALAASTAMLMGLWNGGGRSVWAGSVGTAGAHMLTSLGTFGTVLGWLVVPALFFVSLVFATDWAFHTLRRNAGSTYDPRLLPTEPSRGDLLEEPADAEPREFVPSASRAAEFADAIDVQEPKPLEVAPEALPKGFSAAPVLALGGRTLVRGPSGYSGVEFLQTNDELAIPSAAEEDAPEHDERAMVQSYDFDIELFDAPLAGPDDDAETPAVVTASAPAIEEPKAAAPVAETPAPVAEPSAPVSGIGFADAALYEDEVFAVPSSFDAATEPHDGASAAGEIAATWKTAEVTVAPAAAGEAAVEAVASDDAAVAEVAAEALPAADASEDVSGPRFDDDVIVAGSMFDDDVLYVVDDAREFEPAPSATSSAYPSGSISVLEAPAAVAAATAVAVEPEVAVAAEPAVATPVAVEPEPTLALESADQDWVVDDSMFAPAAEAVAPTATVVAEPVVAEPVVAEPVAAEIEIVPTSTVLVEPADVGVAALDVIVEAPAAAAEAPVSAVAEDVVPATITETVAVEAPAAQPVAVVEPVVTAAPAPVVEPTPAATTSPTSPTAPEAAQLALFPAPAFDKAKLAGMDLDPLFSEAAKAILGRGRASAVVLQRALGIGYARGLRILDQMTAAGMLGPDSPGGAREICFVESPL